MEFKISRTSIWGEDKPCKEAYEKKIIRIDERDFKSFEEHDNRFPNRKWESEGFNHKILQPNNKYDTPHIYREFNDEIWAIEINTLEELINFHNKYGELVIKQSYENPNISEIEIYDDWRE